LQNDLVPYCRSSAMSGPVVCAGPGGVMRFAAAYRPAAAGSGVPAFLW